MKLKDFEREFNIHTAFVLLIGVLIGIISLFAVQSINFLFGIFTYLMWVGVSLLLFLKTTKRFKWNLYKSKE